MCLFTCILPATFEVVTFLAVSPGVVLSSDSLESPTRAYGNELQLCVSESECLLAQADLAEATAAAEDGEAAVAVEAVTGVDDEVDEDEGGESGVLVVVVVCEVISSCPPVRLLDLRPGRRYWE